MDKRIAGLLGAAAALTAVSGASAATEVPASQGPAASYRDLLEPVPNAVAALRADDARARDASASENTRVAQTVIIHHHHHHHHRWWRRWHHHHHHHHHHY